MLKQKELIKDMTVLLVSIQINFGIIAVLFTAVFFISSCSQGPVDVTLEIEEANKAFLDIRQSGDADAMSMLYTSDTKLLLANGMR